MFTILFSLGEVKRNFEWVFHLMKCLLSELAEQYFLLVKLKIHLNTSWTIEKKSLTDAQPRWPWKSSMAWRAVVIPKIALNTLCYCGRSNFWNNVSPSWWCYLGSLCCKMFWRLHFCWRGPCGLPRLGTAVGWTGMSLPVMPTQSPRDRSPLWTQDPGAEFLGYTIK